VSCSLRLDMPVEPSRALSQFGELRSSGYACALTALGSESVDHGRVKSVHVEH
jgi:hypothetical protein